jgi:hypothetical protein
MSEKIMIPAKDRARLSWIQQDLEGVHKDFQLKTDHVLDVMTRYKNLLSGEAITRNELEEICEEIENLFDSNKPPQFIDKLRSITNRLTIES